VVPVGQGALPPGGRSRSGLRHWNWEEQGVQPAPGTPQVVFRGRCAKTGHQAEKPWSARRTGKSEVSRKSPGATHALRPDGPPP